MTLQTARYTLLRDRMDWTRPHLRWIPETLYTMIAKARRAG
ncbi:MAG: hypothetical protein RIG84_20200 [Roseovarius sp.]